MSLRSKIIAGILALSVATAGAQELPLPTDDPILVVSGSIAVTNVGKTAQLDLGLLEPLMTGKIVTSTPWFGSASTFEGIPLDKLMERLGATGNSITAIALNDYVATIPVSDIQAYQPILAMKHNGRFMTVRDKGPLFIIYPYDNDPKLRTHLYYSRSIWQVSELVFE